MSFFSSLSLSLKVASVGTFLIVGDCHYSLVWYVSVGETSRAELFKLDRSCVTTCPPSLPEEQASTVMCTSSSSRRHLSTSRKMSDHHHGEQHIQTARSFQCNPIDDICISTASDSLTTPLFLSHSLVDRTFKTVDFYRKHQDSMTPAGLAFFQSQWDESVTNTFHNTLSESPVIRLAYI